MNRINQNQIEYESFDSQLFSNRYFDNDSGGYVVVNKLHGKSELAQNMVIARILANRGERIILLEDIPNQKSPDAMRNNEIWEFKTICNTENIKNRIYSDIRTKRKQACNILFYITQKFNDLELIDGINNATCRYSEVNKIALLFKEETLIELEREEIMSKNFISIYFSKK